MKEFSVDQGGSRLIQHLFETANWDQKSQIFGELIGDVLNLTVDPFGNYVIQRIFEHGNRSHKRTLTDQLMGHIHEFSVHM